MHAISNAVQVQVNEDVLAFRKPVIISDLYRAFTVDKYSLVDITWEQQCLHESRRWSVMEMMDGINVKALPPSDVGLIWNAGRAELTTKPGADRLAKLSDFECRRWQDQNKVVSSIMQACGTWSRYWNEEEAHHETSLNQIAQRCGMERITDDTFIDFRKIFPDDDMLRTLTLLAISEIVATVNYGSIARSVKDPGLKRLMKQIAADESQHMNYFVAFAKALVDSGEYPAKQALAVAHLFVREGGELYGSKRDEIQERNTHVNWWDHLEGQSALDFPDLIERKATLIYHAISRITGISLSSPEEIEDTWMEMVG
jgi:hypothetical protein